MKPKNKEQARLFAETVAARAKYEEVSTGAEAAFLRKAGANAHSNDCYAKLVGGARKRFLELCEQLRDQGVYYDAAQKEFFRRPDHART